MRFIFTALLMVLPALGQSIQTPTETATRTLERPDGFFVVEYIYEVGGMVFVPATYPSGQNHYSATITVFRVIKGKRQQIGKPFAGQYTLKGCFEDDPKSLVEYALNLL